MHVLSQFPEIVLTEDAKMPLTPSGAPLNYPVIEGWYLLVSETVSPSIYRITYLQVSLAAMVWYAWIAGWPRNAGRTLGGRSLILILTHHLDLAARLCSFHRHGSKDKATLGQC